MPAHQPRSEPDPTVRSTTTEGTRSPITRRRRGGRRSVRALTKCDAECSPQRYGSYARAPCRRGGWQRTLGRSPAHRGGVGVVSRLGVGILGALHIFTSTAPPLTVGPNSFSARVASRYRTSSTWSAIIVR